jgi:hypothetical protein
MARFVSILLAVLVISSSTQAAPYRWRLSERQVLLIAQRAMTAKHFKLSEYSDHTMKRHEKDHEWSVMFSPPMPAPVDSEVLVIVSDRSGDCRVVTHKLPSGPNQTLQPTADRHVNLHMTASTLKSVSQLTLISGG